MTPRRLISAVATLAGWLLVSGAAHSDEPKLAYKPIYAAKLDFGGPISRAFVVDVFDVDNDGAEDMAVSPRGRGSDPTKGKLLHSFIVRNSFEDGALVATDLGEAGRTRHTHAGEFFRFPEDNAVFLFLGRNGEMGDLPSANPGEAISILKITRSGDGFAAEPAYVSTRKSLTASVASCDIDGDGTTEFFFNNYDYPEPDNWLAPRIVQRVDGKFVEERTPKWVFMMLQIGGHNSIKFADMNHDGACDMLAAHEAASHWLPKGGAKPVAFGSYVVMNNGGRIGKSPIFFPNRAFGYRNAGMALSAAIINGEQLLFTDSAAYDGSYNNGAYTRSSIQVYRFENGAFTEVTSEKLDKPLHNSLATWDDIKFADIDGDGDTDVYLSAYSRVDGIDVYLNRNGKFFRTTIRDAGGRGDKAVAFLATPKSRCKDMVVIGSDATMRRYACQAN